LSVETLKAKFDVDTGNAEQAFGKVESKVGGMGKTFANATKILAGTAVAIAAAGAAAYKFVDNYTKKLDVIDKGSQRIGLSAEAYQEWDYILSQNGASIERMEMGMKTLTTQMQLAGTGNAEAIATFQQLGVELKNADGSYRSLEELMPAVITGLSNMGEGVERNALATKLFSRSGQELLPLLNQQKGSIDGLRKKYKELGMGISNDAVKSGALFQDTMDTLTRTVEKMFAALAVQLVPVILELVDAVQPLVPVFVSAIEAIMPMVERVLPKLTDLIIKLMDKLEPLIEELMPVLATLFEVLIDAIGPIIDAVFPVLVDLLIIVAKFLGTVLEAMAPLIPVIVDLIVALMPLIELVLPMLEVWLNAVAWVIENVLVPALMVIISTVTWVVEKVTEAITWLKGFLGPIFTNIGEIITETWDTIKKFTANTWNSVTSFTSEKWNSIKETVTDLANKTREGVESKLAPVINKVSSIWDQVRTEGSAKWTEITGSVINFVTTLPERVSAVLLPIVEGVRAVWGMIWTGVSEAWNNITTNITKWATNIKNSVVGIFTAMKNTLGTVWSSVAGVVKVAFNAVISVVNTAIRGLNRLKIDIPDWVPGMGGRTLGFNIPQIPMLAEGGIVTKPTLAMIGEAGPEAVVPLRDRSIGNGPITVIVELDGEVLTKKTLQNMPSMLRLLGVA